MDESFLQEEPLDDNVGVEAAPDIRALSEKIEKESAFVPLLFTEISKVIVGQKDMVEKLLIGLLANGHVLLEGVPGLAKTLTISSLAEAIDVDFSRIQFTPDLLPADLIGTMIYNQKEEAFSVKKGPIFSNFILADEINRAPAKVQSALLEAMQEKQVTIGPKTYKLPKPFLVLATQNPVEQEGTYPLPEAQVDRFMLKVVIGYPSKEEEKQIIRSNVSSQLRETVNNVVTGAEILKLRETVRQVYMDSKIEQYIVDSISLALASKAYAFIKGRAFVIPDDVRAISMDVLRHRIGISYEAEAENITQEQIVTEIINKVEVP